MNLGNVLNKLSYFSAFAPIRWIVDLVSGGKTFGWSDIFNSGEQSGFDGFKSAAQSIVNKNTGAGLTQAEREANDFNANEAQKQRDYETEMDNTKYQRAVADMRAAGINPALAASNGVASAPAAASASSVSPNSGASLSDILQLALLKPTLRKMNAEADKTENEAELVGKQVGVFDVRNEQELSNMRAQFDELYSRSRLNESGITKNEAESKFFAVQTTLAEMDSWTREKLNSLSVEIRKAELEGKKEQVPYLKAQQKALYGAYIEHMANSKDVSEHTKHYYGEEGLVYWDKELKKYEYNTRGVGTALEVLNGLVEAGTSIAGAFMKGAALKNLGKLGKAKSAIWTPKHGEYDILNPFK